MEHRKQEFFFLLLQSTYHIKAKGIERKRVVNKERECLGKDHVFFL